MGVFDLNQTTHLLRQTPSVIRNLLQPLTDEWVLAREGADGWSSFDVVGHLIHSEETDWIPRARIILEEGERRAFDPFDRFAQFEKSKGKNLAELLDCFEVLRRQNLSTLEELKLSPERLALRGTHPALGTVTLSQLLASWVVHDLSHVSQICRILARHYDAEVGPWKAYMGILG